jgi:hypothetical protein
MDVLERPPGNLYQPLGHSSGDKFCYFYFGKKKNRYALLNGCEAYLSSHYR